MNEKILLSVQTKILPPDKKEVDQAMKQIEKNTKIKFTSSKEENKKIFDQIVFLSEKSAKDSATVFKKYFSEIS